MLRLNRTRLLLFLLLAFVLHKRVDARQRFFGYCERGGNFAVTAGINSTNKVQQSFPGCTVSVFAAGTQNTVPIYSDNSGTVLTDPFTADATTGFWFFYADNARYDIQLSGGGIPTPFTLGDVLLADPALFAATVTSLTAGTGIGVSGSTGAVTVSNTGVVSFNTRTGAVVPTTGDYTYSQISGTPTLEYQTLKVGGSAQTQRAALNLVAGNGVTIVNNDNAGAGSSDVTIASAGALVTITADNTTIQNGLVKVRTNDGIFTSTLTTDAGGISLSGGTIGICLTNCGIAGPQTIQISGAASCAFDPGGSTTGWYVLISGTTNGKCTAVPNYPNGSNVVNLGQIIGRCLTTGSGTQSIELFSPEIQTAQQFTTFTVLDGGGTNTNLLAKLNGSGLAVLAATTDTAGVIGVFININGGGLDTIQWSGIVNCQFDGSTTGGHYAQISTTTAGNCHDAGAGLPASNQVVGRIMGNRVGAGQAPLLVTPDNLANAGGGGGNPFSDAAPLVKSNADATRTITISASAISPGNTNHTYTGQNADYILAGTNIANGFSADQTINNAINVKWQDSGATARTVLQVDASNNFNVGFQAAPPSSGDIDFWVNGSKAATLHLPGGGIALLDPTATYDTKFQLGDATHRLISADLLTLNLDANSGTAGTGFFQAASGTNGANVIGPATATNIWGMVLPIAEGTVNQCLAVQSVAVHVATTYWASCGAGTSAPFSDSTILVQDDADPTMQMRFEIGGFTTKTTHVLTIQDFDQTLASQDITNFWSKGQNMANNVGWNWKDASGTLHQALWADLSNNINIGWISSPPTNGNLNFWANGQQAAYLQVFGGGSAQFNPTIPFVGNFFMGDSAHPITNVEANDFTAITKNGSATVLIQAGSGGGFVNLQGASSSANTYFLQLPGSLGAINTCLQVTGTSGGNTDITGWVSCSSGGAGANTALSNLASTAVNVGINPGVDASISLGTNSFRWQGGVFSGGVSANAFNATTGTNPSVTIGSGSVSTGQLNIYNVSGPNAAVLSSKLISGNTYLITFGSFAPLGDNFADLGAGPSNRFKDLYLAGNLVLSNTQTGATSASLGSTCPAVTCTSAFEYIKMKDGSGNTVFVPAFK